MRAAADSVYNIRAPLVNPGAIPGEEKPRGRAGLFTRPAARVRCLMIGI